MKQKSNSMSYFAISLIMGAIIISFVLTGFEGFNNRSGQAAQVGDEIISLQEYGRAFDRALDFYSQGGKRKLSSKDIRDAKIKETTLDRLVEMKLMLNFAKDLDFDAGKKYNGEIIKSDPTFHVKGQFSVDLYKRILAANRITPKIYEEDATNRVQTQKLSRLLFSVQNSKTSLKDAARIKAMKIQGVLASIEHEAMKKNLEVEPKKIDEYLKVEANEKTLKSLYETYKQRFKFENEKTKKQPKSFEKMKRQLAKEQLQLIDRPGLTKLVAKLKEDVDKLLKEDKVAELEKLGKKYGFVVNTKFEMPLLNLAYKGDVFNPKTILPIIKNKDTKSIVTTGVEFMTTTYFKASKFDNGKVKNEDILKDLRISGQINARMLNKQIINHQGSINKVYKADTKNL